MSQQKQYRVFLDSCLTSPESLVSTPVFDKLKKDDISRFNEAEALKTGALREAIIQKGVGLAHPKDGDLVYFHFTIYPVNDESRVIYSTRPDVENSTGTPLAAVLNKSPRLPRGWELALAEMNQSERRILQLRPEFGFRHPECEYHLPAIHSDSEGDELSIDIQLVHWYPAKEVLTVSVASNQTIIKRMVEDGEGFENPRAPYEVQACICLRKASVDGIQGSGEVLFGSMTTTSPLDLTMGDESIPEGLSSCLGTMVKNEHSFCVISATGFTSSENSLISELPGELQQIEGEIKIVNVIQVRDLYGDGKVMKHRLVDGEGVFPSDCPLQDCRVQIHYKARPLVNFQSSDLDDDHWVFDSRSLGPDPISVELGCGNLPYGLEECIHLMLPGEISRAKCKADAAYNHPNTRCTVPEGMSKLDDAEFEIELQDFTKSVEWRGISTDESIQEAKKTKLVANDLYKQGAVRLAFNKYKTIITQMTSLREFDTEEQIKEADELTITCYSNLAACSIQLEEYPEAINWCNKALKLNEQNAKVLLRRAKAYSFKGDFEQAEFDLNEVLQIDESFTSEVEDAKRKNKQRKIAASMKQRDTFANFFDRD
eukprot:g2526.t1